MEYNVIKDTTISHLCMNGFLALLSTQNYIYLRATLKRQENLKNDKKYIKNQQNN